MEKQKQPLSVGAAIIVAGVLIAGAILFTHKDTLTGTPTAVKTDTASAPVAEQIALSLGMKKAAYEECVANQTYKSVIDADSADGKAAGLQGTPYTILIRPDGKMIAINGAQSYERVAAIIDATLAGTELADAKPTSLNVLPITQNDHLRGSLDAPIKMIEFSDFQCPFCQKFHPTMQKVMQNYPGKIAWVYRHYPLTSIHDEALPRALASECISAELGPEAFWKFVDQIFK